MVTLLSGIGGDESFVVYRGAYTASSPEPPTAQGVVSQRKLSEKGFCHRKSPQGSAQQVPLSLCKATLYLSSRVCCVWFCLGLERIAARCRLLQKVPWSIFRPRLLGRPKFPLNRTKRARETISMELVKPLFLGDCFHASSLRSGEVNVT